MKEAQRAKSIMLKESKIDAVIAKNRNIKSKTLTAVIEDKREKRQEKIEKFKVKEKILKNDLLEKRQ